MDLGKGCRWVYLVNPSFWLSFSVFWEDLREGFMKRKVFEEWRRDGSFRSLGGRVLRMVCLEVVLRGRRCRVEVRYS